MVASTTKKLEQGVDTVLNKIDGIEAPLDSEADVIEPTRLRPPLT